MFQLSSNPVDVRGISHVSSSPSSIFLSLTHIVSGAAIR
ncbi:Uncharacterized protein APZ42_000797 [Daphnia magna]|uniref:Uncharacterized protein n=1 Tax=Daphnia magna TaxID=35525 RepID=A0A164JDD4_9CRUS|nr:Uncharacterized protein APZ42_000797 [Daphnia magna]